MNAIVSALSAENEGEGRAPSSEHDHLFHHSMNYSANILLRRGGIWDLVFEKKRQQHRQTHERLYMSYIFEIAKLKHSKCDGGYLVTIVTQAAPLYPLGPCLTHL